VSPFTLSDAAALIRRLHNRGVSLLPTGSRMKMNAPESTVTTADLELVRTHHDDLLAILKMGIIWYGLSGPSDFTIDL